LKKGDFGFKLPKKKKSKRNRGSRGKNPEDGKGLKQSLEEKNSKEGLVVGFR